MSIEIYLDECSDSDEVIDAFERAGFIVNSPRSAEMQGASDIDHFAYCVKRRFVLLTRNPKDCVEIHKFNSSHPGILLVHQDGVHSKDMGAAQLVRAVQNLLNSGTPIPDNCHVLNHWR